MLLRHILTKKSVCASCIKVNNFRCLSSICWIPNNETYSNGNAKYYLLPRVRGVSEFNPLKKHAYHTLIHRYSFVPVMFNRCESTKPEEHKQNTALTPVAKLKKAVAEYGSTVIVFHITISLFSLGIFYVLVDSGFDIAAFLMKLGIDNESVNKLASNAGTFALAYAIHKVFAPVRLGITLTATPFIVRHFRKIGWLKK